MNLLAFLFFGVGGTFVLAWYLPENLWVLLPFYILIVALTIALIDEEKHG